MHKNISNMRHFISYIMLAIAAISCSKHEEASVSDYQLEEGRRTVIVYMAGENNLSSIANNDVNEMMRGSNAMSKDDRLICFIDKASNEPPFILSLSDGKRDTVMRYSQDFYSCNPDTFRNIINTIVKRFPSKEYGLVLWGHATGWLMRTDTCKTTTEAQARRKAYGADTGTNLEYSVGQRWMNITQMAQALKHVPHLRFIFADCCCMMCAEAAYELRNAADYLIGSPAEIPMDGGPYQLLVKHLFDQSDDFYKGLIDEYFDYYLNNYQSENFQTSNLNKRYLAGHSVPFSVVDLRKMDALADATRPYYSLFQENFNTDSLVFYYAEDYPVMYDMKSLMEKAIQPDEYATWTSVLDEAVVYSRFSAKWMTVCMKIRQQQISEAYHFNEQNYGGISMFIANPAYNYSSTYDYNQRIKQLSWYWTLSQP